MQKTKIASGENNLTRAYRILLQAGRRAEIEAANRRAKFRKIDEEMDADSLARMGLFKAQ